MFPFHYFLLIFHYFLFPFCCFWFMLVPPNVNFIIFSSVSWLLLSVLLLFFKVRIIQCQFHKVLFRIATFCFRFATFCSVLYLFLFCFVTFCRCWNYSMPISLNLVLYSFLFMVIFFEIRYILFHLYILASLNVRFISFCFCFTTF